MKFSFLFCFLLFFSVELVFVFASGTPKPAWVPASANFPIISRTPSSIPTALTFVQGSNFAYVNISTLNPVRGVKVCIQRSMSPPKELDAWVSCTYHYEVFDNHTMSTEFSFDTIDVEGNVQYFVNVVILDPETHTTSLLLLWTVQVCPPGFARSLHNPSTECAPVNPLKSGHETNFIVDASSSVSSHYFSLQAPNTNPNEIVTGFHMALRTPATSSWTVYASANMAPTYVSHDFYSSSDLIDRDGDLWLFHIVVPSPGVWYFTFVLNHDNPSPVNYTATLKAVIQTEQPKSIGAEIQDDTKLMAGPTENVAGELKLYSFQSPDGALDLSLGVLNPLALEGRMIPFQIYVAVNAVPGSFNGSIASDGSNVFADWIGCSAPPNFCKDVTRVNLPKTPRSSTVTYIVGVLPVGNFSGLQFALWRNSPCPYCERGTCQTSPENYGTCKCPKNWIHINCGLWASKSLTPQVIVIISMVSFFAACGLVLIIYFIIKRVSKREDSPEKLGYSTINDSPQMS